LFERIIRAPQANVKRCMGKSGIRISEGSVQQYE